MTKNRQTLKMVGVRLLWVLVTLMAIRASAYTAVQLFGVVDGTSLHKMVVNGARAILDGVSLESMDPVLVMLLVPGLMVAALAMGGLILWNRKTR